MTYTKIKISLGLFIFILTGLFASRALAYEDIRLTLESGGSPITTALDLRISLWDIYDLRSGDIDGNGDINTSATHYGNYRITVLNITPDSNGKYVLNTGGLTGFPASIANTNLYLQLEYKNQGDSNTDYQDYDFVNDPPWNNITRYLLTDNISYITSDAGAQTYNNTFTLDANNNASTDITLEFGETLAESLKWSKANVRFELSDDLYINGSLEIAGNQDFNLYQLIEAVLENLASAPTCGTGSKGRLYYNTTDNLIYFCNGTTWNRP